MPEEHEGLVGRFSRWLHEGAEPSPGDVVELVRVPTAFEGEAIAGRLEAAGIEAAVFPSDADGIAPHYAFGQGCRVMIHAADLDLAASVLAEDVTLPVDEADGGDTDGGRDGG